MPLLSQIPLQSHPEKKMKNECETGIRARALRENFMNSFPAECLLIHTHSVSVLLKQCPNHPNTQSGQLRIATVAPHSIQTESSERNLIFTEIMSSSQKGLQMGVNNAISTTCGCTERAWLLPTLRVRNSVEVCR